MTKRDVSHILIKKCVISADYTKLIKYCVSKDASKTEAVLKEDNTTHRAAWTNKIISYRRRPATLESRWTKTNNIICPTVSKTVVECGCVLWGITTNQASTCMLLDLCFKPIVDRGPLITDILNYHPCK